MREVEQKETLRELTDEETKAVSGGSTPHPGWSNGLNFNGPYTTLQPHQDGNWRDNK